MPKYDKDDQVTFYFVVNDIHDDGSNLQIQGYTDNKELAKMYMEFHKCKKFHLKKITDSFGNILKIIQENVHDEIQLVNRVIKNPKPKKGHETELILIPMTQTECTMVNTEASEFMASRINYGWVAGCFHYLKDKYQNAIRDIFLYDVMRKVVYERSSPLVESIQQDELLILFRSFCDNFGR